MKFPKELTLSELANIIDVKYIGDPNFPVEGVNEIHVVESGDVVFVDHPKYYDAALSSAATVVLINKEVDCPEGKALLISEDPFTSFNKIITHFSEFHPSNKMIDSSAIIGQGTVIQPGTFVGNNVVIGSNCLIHPNVTIYDNVVIGDNVIIHAGAVLGADAFYFKNRGTHRDKLLSCGGVRIESNVEIGANSTIDRGVTAITTIGEGTKLDNMVQVGHDTVIGENCIFASGVAIAGCVVIENNVVMWGKSTIGSGVRVAEGTQVLAMSGIELDTQKGKRYFGVPAVEAREKFKQMVNVKRIPDIMNKLKDL